MKNYLRQLIDDMHEAATNLPVKPYYDIPPEAEGLEYVIEWENAQPKPMQEWFGIDKTAFPPVDKLTASQLDIMVVEILKLWEAYNFEALLPEGLPTKVAYNVLTGFFDKNITWVSKGISSINLCDVDPENCPFPEEFCMCKDLDDNPGDSLYTENADEISLMDKEIREIEAKNEDEFKPIVKMQAYVEQVLGDMETVVQKMSRQEIIPNSTEARGVEDTRQLIENPWVTIEELTEIESAVFPEHIDMDGLQTRKLLRAMLRVLDVFNLKVYFPDEIPHEIKYEALRDYWDVYEIKHLPLSGDDIELCTGDPMTCHFGEFCDCNDDIPDDEPPGPSDNNLQDYDELPF